MDLHQAYKSIAQKEGMKKTQRDFEEEQDEMPCSSYISVLKKFRIIFNWDSIARQMEPNAQAKNWPMSWYMIEEASVSYEEKHGNKQKLIPYLTPYAEFQNKKKNTIQENISLMLG